MRSGERDRAGPDLLLVQLCTCTFAPVRDNQARTAHHVGEDWNLSTRRQQLKPVGNQVLHVKRRKGVYGDRLRYVRTKTGRLFVDRTQAEGGIHQVPDSRHLVALRQCAGQDESAEIIPDLLIDGCGRAEVDIYHPISSLY